jgi:diguanylate cyclase (GGDEF)-like protein/PAS domain S-box-containing protein
MTVEGGREFTMDVRLGALVLKAATELADPFRPDLAEVASGILEEVCDLFGVSRARVWLQDPAARRLVPAAVHYRDGAPLGDLPVAFAQETVRKLERVAAEHGGLVPLGGEGPVPELKVGFDDGPETRLGMCIPVQPGGRQGGLVTLCGLVRPPSGAAERGAIVAIGRLLVGAEAANDLLRRLSALWDTGHVGLVIRDPQRRLLQANGAYCEMVGVPLDDLVGRDAEGLVHEDDAERTRALIDGVLSGREDHVENEYRILRRGEERWMRAHIARVARSDGVLGYTFSVVEDVTERRRAEQRLRESERRHRSVVENAPALVVRADRDGIIVFASHRSLSVVGLGHEHLVGASVEALGVTDPPGRWSAAVVECIASAEIVELETRIRVGDGWRWIWARLAPEVAVDGESTGVTLYALDVTRRKTVELQLERAARRDSLTGLLNRTAFADRLAERLAASPGGCGALLFVDLDRFKHINDSMGHLVGDEVLSCVAGRLRGAVAEPGLVARVGGDEFLVHFESSGGVGAVRAEAERLRMVLEEPMRIGGSQILTSVSIGVAVAAAEMKADELVHAADLAMYAAKEAGRNRVVFHDDALEARLGLRSMLETDLRGAVGRDELVVVYQPEVDLATGRLVGVEALVRWDHPERGRLGAADFVEIAEDSGLLVDIGEYALRRTWQDLAAWTDLPSDFRCRVNLSAVQLASPDDLLHLLDELAGTAPSLRLLCIELTETALLAEPDTARVVLESIRARGGSVAIDDFGTGYGGFTYVKSFPVDLLKIDRSFVADVVDDPYDRAIVEAIIGLATSLGMEVSAEGIESAAQAETLVAMGCRRGQGFLFGSAVSAAEIQRLLRSEVDRGPEPAER